jgi:tetratricopeptide (TPR) repeat protein
MTTVLPKRLLCAIVGILISLGSSVALAKDPFRTSNPHKIGDPTEAAFRTMFVKGDYKGAVTLLNQALKQDTTDPMPYSLRAAIAYLNEDWSTFGQYGTKIRQVAERLTPSDPLRGNLYTAVGHFFEGAYTLQQEGTVKGVPKALVKLQQVYKYLGEAEKISPTDPELNLIKGYMDLMLAVNLPFADPNEAIDRLEKYASPSFLVQRGLALGYRDLDKQAQALSAVDKAIAQAPDNPDLFYLKAQILVRQKRNAEALTWFDKAIAKQSQLMPGVVRQLRYEHCRTQKRVDKRDRDCSALVEG